MAGAGTAAAGPPWPGGAAWIGGRYRPVEEAKISVLDLGVTRSDCTYDVVHVWDGRFFRLAAHLDRFAASLARLRLDPGYDRAQIEAILHGCVRHAGLRRAYVSMTCTRGRLPPGSRDLRAARPTFYCYAVPFVWVASPERQETGVSLRVSDLVRIPSASVDPRVKNYHWLDLDLALLEAYEHGADLVVLRDLSGAVTEGPGYNVFAWVDGRWLTPAAGTLAGVTRRTVIELARQAGQPVAEGPLSAGDLRRASEVLVTSTAGGVIPVTAVDGEPVGTGGPGPLTRQLRDRYWASHADPAYATPVRYDEPGLWPYMAKNPHARRNARSAAYPPLSHARIWARTVLSMCRRLAASRGRTRRGLQSLAGAGEGDNAAAVPFAQTVAAVVAQVYDRKRPQPGRRAAARAGSVGPRARPCRGYRCRPGRGRRRAAAVRL